MDLIKILEVLSIRCFYIVILMVCWGKYELQTYYINIRYGLGILITGKYIFIKYSIV